MPIITRNLLHISINLFGFWELCPPGPVLFSLVPDIQKGSTHIIMLNQVQNTSPVSDSLLYNASMPLENALEI